MWSKNKDVNRILLLEPSHFSTYPVSDQVMSFIMEMASEIQDIQIAVMEFDQLYELLPSKMEIHFKEHPFTNHYNGNGNGKGLDFSKCGSNWIIL